MSSKARRGYRSTWIALTASRLRWALVLSTVTAVAACNRGPSGPGTLQAVIESPTVTAGAVVLEVRGVGVNGITATPPIQSFSAPGSTPGSFRVVLVNPGDVAPLTLGITVDDLAADPPTATVVEATSLTNLPILDPSSLVLRILP